MSTKYAPGARPPSATIQPGDTSRYPTGGELPPRAPLPTDVPDFMKETPGYMDGCSQEMVK